jgi:hypothetical protein
MAFNKIDGSSTREVSDGDCCKEEAGKELCADLVAGAELVRCSGDCFAVWSIVLLVCMATFA